MIKKRRNSIPEEIRALAPPGTRLNEKSTKGVYQVYTAIDLYDPKTKKRSEKRTYIGQIKDGVFTFTTRHLLRMKEQELQEHKARQNTPEPIVNTPEKVLEMTGSIEDDRQQSKVLYRLDHVLLVALLSALSGETSCVAIADYWSRHRKFLERAIPQFPEHNISHDTVRRVMMICSPDRLKDLFSKMVEPLLKLMAWRTVAVDGQAVRASGTKRDPRYVLNFYDTENGVAIGQCLVGEKTNETTVAPEMIEGLDLQGSVVTCDALNTRCDFAAKLLMAGADYCMAVKDNWRRLLRGIQSAFANANEEEVRTVVDQSTGHGRIETRTLHVLPGHLLDRKLRARWLGLCEGTIVKTTTEAINKSTGDKSVQDRYYVTSLRFRNPNIATLCATSIRNHWAIENELHYVLDVNFYQDGTQCKNANYLINRVRLNQMAHGIVNRVRKLNPDPNGELKSRKRIMNALSLPEFALEQLEKLYKN